MPAAFLMSQSLMSQPSASSLTFPVPAKDLFSTATTASTGVAIRHQSWRSHFSVQTYSVLRHGKTFERKSLETRVDSTHFDIFFRMMILISMVKSEVENSASIVPDEVLILSVGRLTRRRRKQNINGTSKKDSNS